VTAVENTNNMLDAKFDIDQVTGVTKYLTAHSISRHEIAFTAA
jgi:hypothetical protein